MFKGVILTVGGQDLHRENHFNRTIQVRSGFAPFSMILEGTENCHEDPVSDLTRIPLALCSHAL